MPSVGLSSAAFATCAALAMASSSFLDFQYDGISIGEHLLGSLDGIGRNVGRAAAPPGEGAATAAPLFGMLISTPCSWKERGEARDVDSPRGDGA